MERYKKFFKESTSLNWNEVDKIFQSLWTQSIEEFGTDFDKRQIETAISKIEKGFILSGGSPEVIVSFKNNKFFYCFDGELELKSSNKEEIAAYFVIFSGDNGDPNKYLISYNWNTISKIVGRNNEGCAYVVYGTLEGLKEGKDPQQAFIDSCENENYYGDRSDIVKYRIFCAKILREHFNIDVNPAQGF